MNLRQRSRFGDRRSPNAVLNPDNEIVAQTEKVQVKLIRSSGVECFKSLRVTSFPLFCLVQTIAEAIAYR